MLSLFLQCGFSSSCSFQSLSRKTVAEEGREALGHGQPPWYPAPTLQRLLFNYGCLGKEACGLAGLGWQTWSNEAGKPSGREKRGPSQVCPCWSTWKHVQERWLNEKAAYRTAPRVRSLNYSIRVWERERKRFQRLSPKKWVRVISEC